jgi:arylsulfatase A-like enzyme
MGSKLFRKLVESYDSRDEALRHFIQAYLASVASVDEQVGRILDVIDSTELKDNTIIVLTSDHGWGMGEKDYLYKNSLWQESTRIPLIVRAPCIAQADTVCDQPVSLVDIYPTLADCCGLKGDTMKNGRGHPLDGHSFRPLLTDPYGGTWNGPDEALTALYKWRMKYDPHEESYSLRSHDWRYIRYENGREELYDTDSDPNEWKNLATETTHKDRMQRFRQTLASRLPEKGIVPPQPQWKAPGKPEPKSNEHWKDLYFKKNPEADTNADGVLSWPEFHAHKKTAETAAQTTK